MTIFGDVQRNVFNINLKFYEKNIPLNIESMNYSYENKWKNNNEYKTVLLDLNHHPEYRSDNKGMMFLQSVFNIFFNDKNSYYYCLSHWGIFKTKDFVNFRKIYDGEPVLDYGMGNAAAMYNGTLYCLTARSLISINKSDEINNIANQNSNIALSYRLLNINEDGQLYCIDWSDNIYVKQWDSFIKRAQLPRTRTDGAPYSFQFYRNNILVTTNYGIFLSKDSGNTFFKLLEWSQHGYINTYTYPENISTCINSEGIILFESGAKNLYKFNNEGNRSSRKIDLGTCKKFYSKNGTHYALCHEGVYKSSDWIYWSKVNGILANSNSSYFANNMFVDDKYEVYSTHGTNMLKFKEKN